LLIDVIQNGARHEVAHSRDDDQDRDRPDQALYATGSRHGQIVA